MARVCGAFMMFYPVFMFGSRSELVGEISRTTNIRFYSTHCIALEVAAATVTATAAAAATATTTPQRGNDQIK